MYNRLNLNENFFIEYCNKWAGIPALSFLLYNYIQNVYLQESLDLKHDICESVVNTWVIITIELRSKDTITGKSSWNISINY